MTVLQATLSDLPELSELLGMLFAMEPEFHKSVDTTRQEAGLRAIIGDPKIGIVFKLVNTDGDKLPPAADPADTGTGGKAPHIIGTVCLLFTISTGLGGRAAILEDFIVRPEYRGCGAGKLLLNAAIEEARRQQCKRITLLTDRDNESAQAFYLRAGFHASRMVPYRIQL